MTQPAGNSLPGGGRPVLEYQQPRRDTGGGFSVVVSWMVILASVALVVTFNQIGAQRRKLALPQLLAPNVPLELSARYAAGMHSLNPPHGRTAVDPSLILVQQLDAAAKSFPDRLRVAIVAGELQGDSVALRRIDAIGPVTQWPELSGDVQTLRTIYRSGADAVSPVARQHLLDRYGWYAHLALGFGKADSDPGRKLAVQAARRTMIAVILALVLILIALAAGLVLLIVALVRVADGKITRAYVPSVDASTPFLEAFAIYIGLYVSISLLVGRLSGHTNLGLGYYLFAGILPVAFALVWPLFRGVPVPQWRYGLGWHLGTGLLREMFFGVVAYLAGLPLMAAGVVVTLVLSRVSGANTSHPITNEADGLQSALKLLLLAAVYAPLVEESLFRGALFHHLRGRHGWLFSAVIVSLIFAAMHPQGWAAIPTLGAIGFTFAGIREWRGTIVASAAAHALNNGFVMILLIVATS
jgi:membrane protease YdiL (CAAX protease family)